MKETCLYLGKELSFVQEFKDSELDDAQYMIDYHKKNGREACCLHENGKHQLYVDLPERLVMKVSNNADVRKEDRKDQYFS